MGRPTIYALRDPVLDCLGYVGLSMDAHKRFREHLAAGRWDVRAMAKEGLVRLPVTDSVARWLGFLLAADIMPELVTLEQWTPASIGHFREREGFWHDKLCAEGHPLTNGRGRFSLVGWRPSADRSQCRYSALLAEELTVYRVRDIITPRSRPDDVRWDAPCVRFDEAVELMGRYRSAEMRRAAVPASAPKAAMRNDTGRSAPQPSLRQLRPPPERAGLGAAAPVRTPRAVDFDPIARAADATLPEHLRYWGA